MSKIFDNHMPKMELLNIIVEKEGKKDDILKREEDGE